MLSKYNASANPDPNPDIFHSKTPEISVEHQRAHEQFRQAIKYRNCTDLHPVKVFNRDPDFEPVRISGNRSVQFLYFNYFSPGFSSQLVDQSTFLFPYTIFLLGTGNHNIRCYFLFSPCWILFYIIVNIKVLLEILLFNLNLHHFLLQIVTRILILGCKQRWAYYWRYRNPIRLVSQTMFSQC